MAKKKSSQQPRKTRQQSSSAPPSPAPPAKTASPIARLALALAWLPLAALFAAGAVAFLARFAMRISPEYIVEVVGRDLPDFLSAWRPGGEASLEATARASAAWLLMGPILLSWPLIAGAGLIGQLWPLGWRGAAGAFFVYWAATLGPVMAVTLKAMRFLKVKDLPPSYAFLDATGAGGEALKAAAALHSGFEQLWMAMLFGAAAGAAVAGFIRAIPEKKK
jgi:hypothetical protein